MTRIKEILFYMFHVIFKSPSLKLVSLFVTLNELTIKKIKELLKNILNMAKIIRKTKKEYIKRLWRLRFWQILFHINNIFLLIMISYIWAKAFFSTYKNIEIYDLSFFWYFYKDHIIIWYPYVCFYFYMIILPIAIMKIFLSWYIIENQGLFVISMEHRILRNIIDTFLVTEFWWCLDDERTEADVQNQIRKVPAYYYLDKVFFVQIYKLILSFWIITSNYLMFKHHYFILFYLWNIWTWIFKSLIVQEMIHYIILIFFIWILSLSLLLLYLKITEFFEKE